MDGGRPNGRADGSGQAKTPFGGRDEDPGRAGGNKGCVNEDDLPFGTRCTEPNNHESAASISSSLPCFSNRLFLPRLDSEMSNRQIANKKEKLDPNDKRRSTVKRLLFVLAGFYRSTVLYKAERS